MRKHVFRKNKGITLVSLAVTIIVLIILTVVVINTTIGENGVIRVSERKELESRLKVIEEEANLAYGRARLGKNIKKGEIVTLKDVIERLSKDYEIYEEPTTLDEIPFI